MPNGKIKHVFPGGNTSLGFFSNFNYILDLEETVKMILIKGGPGVGKSTFMKKIGYAMLEKGYDIELMHCASDSNSLDGVVIPELGYALIDGTAPHVLDPKYPGAVDEIINFGDFWNEDGIRVHKEDIINDTKAAGKFSSRAYRYLKAALSVYEDSAVIYDWALHKGELNILASELVEELFKDKTPARKEGKQRCLFASAITPEGFRNYLDSIITVGKVYEIKGRLGTGEEKLLEKIKNAAIEKGYNVEAYYCAFKPDKLEHLVIPGIDAAFTTSNAYHRSKVKKQSSIDMQQYLDREVLDEYSDCLHQNQEEFDNLLSIALLNISKAKAIHDRLETYYIPYIDFKAIDLCFEKTLAKILGT